MSQAETYGSYLKIRELLALQVEKSEAAEHDEMLFIIIHQVYELWFKQILHEMDQMIAHIHEDDLASATHQLVRILKVLKTLVGQLDILETMTPLEFLSFRDFLGSASGFQSAQFREVEYALGYKNADHLERFEGMPEQEALRARLDSPSLWATFLGYLARQGFAVPSEVLHAPVQSSTAPSEQVQAALVDAYRSDSGLRSFCESLTDLDEGLQEWRYRHVMMVRRTIGTRGGTGGSEGAAYLTSTLFHPVFPDLWDIRTQL